MIVPAVFVFLFVFLFATMFAIQKGATIIISRVAGIMIGGLVNKDYYEEEDIVETTIQFCFVFLTFTFQWEEKIG